MRLLGVVLLCTALTACGLPPKRTPLDLSGLADAIENRPDEAR